MTIGNHTQGTLSLRATHANSGETRSHTALPISLYARRFVMVLLSIFFVIITLLSAIATSTLQINAPSSVNEGQPLTMTLTGPGTVSISYNNAVVASGIGTVTYTQATSSTSAGIYTYGFSSDAPNVPAQTQTIEVVNVPLLVTPTTPSSTDVTTNNVLFSLNTNWPADMCYVLIDGAGHTLNSLGASVNTSATFANSSINSSASSPALYGFSANVLVPDGVHTIDYKCTLGSELANATRTINVDTTPPIILTSAPTGEITGSFITLSVDTNELAQCRYGVADASYASLAGSMGASYALHSSVVLQDVSEGSATYYVRCADVYGNEMVNSTIISFSHRLLPIATIRVDGQEPLASGTHKVTLTTNVPLGSTPVLTASLPQSKQIDTIVLSGDGMTWTGYLIIPKDLPDDILTFSFNGVSTRGVVGTQISQGATFTLGAAPAPAIDNLVARSDKNGILLSWSVLSTNTAIFDGSSTGTGASSSSSAVSSSGSSSASSQVTYRIYRATHEGVTVADYYATSSSTQFFDAASTDSRYYYYRVAAVSPAGSLGTLSQEVFGSAIDKSLDVSQTLDASTIARIDAAVVSIDALLAEVNQTIIALNGLSNTEELRIAEDMALVQHARASRSTLEDKRRALVLMRESSPTTPTPQQIDAALSDANAAVDAARLSLIKKIVPLQAIDLKQPADSDALERNAPYAFVGSSFPSSDQEAVRSYVQQAVTMQDHATVMLTASTFRLFDASGGAREYTFIRKKILLDDPRNDVVVIENIPKSVAKSVDDVRFNDEVPTIIERDPVVSYSLPVLKEYSFTYVLSSAASLEEVKKSRTFVYPSATIAAQAPSGSASSSLPASPSASSSPLTGFVTSSLSNSLSSAFSSSNDLLLVVIGIIIIIGLGAYYVHLGSDPAPFKGGRDLPRRLRPESTHAVNSMSDARGNVRGADGFASPTSMSSMRIVGRKIDERRVPSSAPIAAIAAFSVPSVHPVTLRSSVSVPSTSSSTALLLPSRSSEDVVQWLSSIERSIDNKSYDFALVEYKRILQSLESDEGLSSMLQDSLVRVYTKITLYRHLSDAHNAIIQKDSSSLRSLLEQVRMTAAQIGEEQTPLIRDAKASYTQFVQELNVLEIERAKKY